MTRNVEFQNRSFRLSPKLASISHTGQLPVHLGNRPFSISNTMSFTSVRSAVASVRLIAEHTTDVDESHAAELILLAGFEHLRSLAARRGAARYTRQPLSEIKAPWLTRLAHDAGASP